MDDEVGRFLDYVKAGKTILDAGCGPGRYTKQFMERGYEAIGIDFPSNMPEEAMRLVPGGSSG